MQPTVRTKFADLSLRRSGFNPRLLHVRFVRAKLDWDRICAGKVRLGQDLCGQS